ISGLYGQGCNQGCGLKPISALSKDEEKMPSAFRDATSSPDFQRSCQRCGASRAHVSVPESAGRRLESQGARGLVADGGGAGGFDGFGETPAHWTQDESRHFPLRSERDVGCFLGELGAAVQQQPSLSQELG